MIKELQTTIQNIQAALDKEIFTYKEALLELIKKIRELNEDSLVPEATLAEMEYISNSSQDEENLQDECKDNLYTLIDLLEDSLNSSDKIAATTVPGKAEIARMKTVYKQTKDPRILKVLGNWGLDISEEIKTLPGYDRLLYEPSKKYEVIGDKATIQKYKQVIDSFNAFLKGDQSTQTNKLNDIRKHFEDDGFINFNSFKKMVDFLQVSSDVKPILDDLKDQGVFQDKVTIADIEKFIKKLGGSYENYQKGIFIPHRVDFDHAKNFSSVGTDKQRSITLHFDPMLFMPPNINKNLITHILEKVTHHAPGNTDFGFMRFTEKEITVGDLSKKVWFVEEVQTDFMEGVYNQLKSARVDDVFEEDSDIKKSDVQAILDYFKNWQYILWNHFISKVKKAEVDEVWITPAEAQVVKWGPTNPQARIKSWKHLYDFPAARMGAELQKTVDEYLDDTGGGRSIKWDTFYVINVEDLPDHITPARS